MSMSFEVFPTKKIIPKCNEVIKCSVGLFSEFMRREKIICDIEVTVSEILFTDKMYKTPINLASKQDHYTVFNVNREGEIYVFYHDLTEVDKDFWDMELQDNKNAQVLNEKVNVNLEIGFFWSIKRTLGQPAIASLYYGYLAIAIAILTDGIIYSDDGAWEYSVFPVEGSVFKDIYLDIDKIHDATVKENIETWLKKVKS